MLRKKKFQCKILIVPEEGWFGQPKYSTPSKKPLRCVGFFIVFWYSLWTRPPHLMINKEGQLLPVSIASYAANRRRNLKNLQTMLYTMNKNYKLRKKLQLLDFFFLFFSLSMKKLDIVFLCHATFSILCNWQDLWFSKAMIELLWEAFIFSTLKLG